LEIGPSADAIVLGERRDDDDAVEPAGTGAASQ
jgi:hypothetical protein